jgi:hypothetical protein
VDSKEEVMAPSCSLEPKERTLRISIGAAFVTAGFVLHHDSFAAVALVSTGSAMTAAAALGY